MFSTPGLKEARQKLLYMTMSDKERRAYDEHIDQTCLATAVIAHYGYLLALLELKIYRGSHTEKGIADDASLYINYLLHVVTIDGMY